MTERRDVMGVGATPGLSPVWTVLGRRGRQPVRPRGIRSIPALSAWDRAVVDFGVAWHLSPTERTALRLTLRTATRRLDALVRELLVEVGGLALEVGRPELAAWCYAACERVTNDVDGRATWDDVSLERPLLEPLLPIVTHALTPESLVWWCIRLVPRLEDEAPDAARRRMTVYAFYLSVMVVQAFTADDAAGRERAGVLAVLGGVIARRSRAMVAGASA